MRKGRKRETPVALRIKLRLGLKLCKLPGRFWASVNKVNYSVNYNFFARSRVGPQAFFRDYSFLDSRFYTQSFSSGTPPSSWLLLALIIVNGTKQPLNVEEFDSELRMAGMGKLNDKEKVRTLGLFWAR